MHSLEVEPLEDLGEGRYLCKYMVRDEAEWTIDILVDGSPIQRSPFTPAFDAGATDPSRCVPAHGCILDAD